MEETNLSLSEEEYKAIRKISDEIEISRRQRIMLNETLYKICFHDSKGRDEAIPEGKKSRLYFEEWEGQREFEIIIHYDNSEKMMRAGVLHEIAECEARKKLADEMRKSDYEILRDFNGRIWISMDKAGKIIKAAHLIAERAERRYLEEE